MGIDNFPSINRSLAKSKKKQVHKSDVDESVQVVDWIDTLKSRFSHTLKVQSEEAIRLENDFDENALRNKYKARIFDPLEEMRAGSVSPPEVESEEVEDNAEEDEDSDIVEILSSSDEQEQEVDDFPTHPPSGYSLQNGKPRLSAMGPYSTARFLDDDQVEEEDDYENDYQHETNEYKSDEDILVLDSEEVSEKESEAEAHSEIESDAHSDEESKSEPVSDAISEDVQFYENQDQRINNLHKSSEHIDHIIDSIPKESDRESAFTEQEPMSEQLLYNLDNTQFASYTESDGPASLEQLQKIAEQLYDEINNSIHDGTSFVSAEESLVDMIRNEIEKDIPLTEDVGDELSEEDLASPGIPKETVLAPLPQPFDVIEDEEIQIKDQTVSEGSEADEDVSEHEVPSETVVSDSENSESLEDEFPNFKTVEVEPPEVTLLKLKETEEKFGVSLQVRKKLQIDLGLDPVKEFLRSLKAVDIPMLEDVPTESESEPEEEVKKESEINTTKEMEEIEPLEAVEDAEIDKGDESPKEDETIEAAEEDEIAGANEEIAGAEEDEEDDSAEPITLMESLEQTVSVESYDEESQFQHINETDQPSEYSNEYNISQPRLQKFNSLSGTYDGQITIEAPVAPHLDSIHDVTATETDILAISEDSMVFSNTLLDDIKEDEEEEESAENVSATPILKDINNTQVSENDLNPSIADDTQVSLNISSPMDTGIELNEPIEEPYEEPEVQIQETIEISPVEIEDNGEIDVSNEHSGANISFEVPQDVPRDIEVPLLDVLNTSTLDANQSVMENEFDTSVQETTENPSSEGLVNSETQIENNDKKENEVEYDKTPEEASDGTKLQSSSSELESIISDEAPQQPTFLYNVNIPSLSSVNTSMISETDPEASPEIELREEEDLIVVEYPDNVEVEVNEDQVIHASNEIVPDSPLVSNEPMNLLSTEDSDFTFQPLSAPYSGVLIKPTSIIEPFFEEPKLRVEEDFDINEEEKMIRPSEIILPEEVDEPKGSSLKYDITELILEDGDEITEYVEVEESSKKRRLDDESEQFGFKIPRVAVEPFLWLKRWIGSRLRHRAVGEEVKEETPEVKEDYHEVKPSGTKEDVSEIQEDLQEDTSGKEDILEETAQENLDEQQINDEVKETEESKLKPNVELKLESTKNSENQHLEKPEAAVDSKPEVKSPRTRKKKILGLEIDTDALEPVHSLRDGHKFGLETTQKENEEAEKSEEIVERPRPRRTRRTRQKADAETKPEIEEAVSQAETDTKEKAPKSKPQKVSKPKTRTRAPTKAKSSTKTKAKSKPTETEPKSVEHSSPTLLSPTEQTHVLPKSPRKRKNRTVSGETFNEVPQAEELPPSRKTSGKWATESNDNPANRTRSKSPLKESLQDIITDDVPIGQRTRRKRKQVEVTAEEKEEEESARGRSRKR